MFPKTDKQQQQQQKKGSSAFFCAFNPYIFHFPPSLFKLKFSSYSSSTFFHFFTVFPSLVFPDKSVKNSKWKVSEGHCAPLPPACYATVLSVDLVLKINLFHYSCSCVLFCNWCRLLFMKVWINCNFVQTYFINIFFYWCVNHI